MAMMTVYFLALLTRTNIEGFSYVRTFVIGQRSASFWLLFNSGTKYPDIHVFHGHYWEKMYMKDLINKQMTRSNQAERQSKSCADTIKSKQQLCELFITIIIIWKKDVKTEAPAMWSGFDILGRKQIILFQAGGYDRIIYIIKWSDFCLSFSYCKRVRNGASSWDFC